MLVVALIYQAQGRVRMIGVSNFSRTNLERIMRNAMIPPSVVQVEVHPYWRQEKLLAFCEQKEMHVTAYSALGSADSESLLKRPSKRLLDDPVVQRVAEREGIEKAQALIIWGLQKRPESSLLCKSVTTHRIDSNLSSVRMRLGEISMEELSSLHYQRRMVDGSVFLSPSGPYKCLADLWDRGEEGVPPNELNALQC